LKRGGRIGTVNQPLTSQSTRLLNRFAAVFRLSHDWPVNGRNQLQFQSLPPSAGRYRFRRCKLARRELALYSGRANSPFHAEPGSWRRYEVNHEKAKTLQRDRVDAVLADGSGSISGLFEGNRSG